MTEKECLVLLNMVVGMTPHRLKKLMGRYDPLQKVFAASRDELLYLIGNEEVAENIRKAPSTDILKAELESARAHRIGIITLRDDAYPALLNEIPDAPAVLYVMGELCAEDGLAVAFVGSREATPYGITVAETLAGEVCGYGVTIVSGLAAGIDSAAHRGALKRNGRTLAVLGSGLLQIYPRENKALAEAIAEDGAVLSEFPLNTPPHAYHFPRRNRIISGLSRGVVVVEAKKTSGSLITASFALEQGREVFAIPGRVGSLTSQGTHNLIRQGAHLVETAQDIIQELGMCVRAKKTASASLPRQQVPLEPDEAVVFGQLTEEAQHIDEITAGLALPAEKGTDILFRLMRKKMVRELPGKFYVKTG